MSAQYDIGALAYALDAKARPSGRNWRIRCPNPAHEDKTPSCDLSETEDGQLLWHCHGCKDQDGVYQGIKATGLYHFKPDGSLYQLRRGNWIDSLISTLSSEEAEEIQPGMLSMNDIMDMDFPPDEPLIGPVYRGKICMFVAPTSAGKSFFAHGLAHAAANKTLCGPWLSSGKHNVTVVDGELSGTDHQRIAAALNVRGNYNVIANYLNPGQTLNLMDIAQQNWLCERVEGQDLVLFDNLYSLFPSTEELKSVGLEYMQVLLSFLVRLKQQGTTSVVFDHPGKSGTQYGSAAKTWGCDLVGVMSREDCEGFTEGQAGFYMTFRSEDGGKVRGQFDATLHNSLRWELKPMGWTAK